MKLPSSFKQLHVHLTLRQAWFAVLIGMLACMIFVAAYGAVMFARVSDASLVTVDPDETIVTDVRHGQFNEAITLFSQRVNTFERLRVSPNVLPTIAQ